jgi:FG-GAP-like repeat
VNGDGNLDLLVSILDNSAAGNTAQIYAGKGDGTFQGTPLYAVPLPNSTEVFSAAIGDVNYLTLWPNGETQPVVSTLNAPDGAITSNMAIVPTTKGSVNGYATNSTNLILDLSSYFAP